MDIKQEITFDSGTASGAFSIKKQGYIEIDGEKTYVGMPTRLAVAPGEIEQVNEFAPELVPIMTAIWTPEIIQAWADTMAKLESEVMTSNI